MSDDTAPMDFRAWWAGEELGFRKGGFEYTLAKAAWTAAQSSLATQLSTEVARLREALTEMTAEAVEHRRDIVAAKQAGFHNIDDPKYRQAYDREIARFDALIGRARVAIAAAKRSDGK